MTVGVRVQPFAEQRTHLCLSYDTGDAEPDGARPCPLTGRLPGRRVVRRQRGAGGEPGVMRRHLPDQVQVPVPGVQHMDRHHGDNCSYRSGVSARGVSV